MELKIVCSTWIKADDEKVLKVLQASDTWLSVAELAQRTGLPPHRVSQTLRLLKQQMELYESRQRFLQGE